jgi:uncharacterized protein (TIGR02246 family)
MIAELVALALAGSTQAAHSAHSCPKATSAAVEAQFERFNAAWATKNPDTVTALFTKEPVLLPTISNKPRTTPAEVRDYFVTFLKGSPSARIDSSTVEIDCKTASRLGTWTVSLTDASTGVASEVKGRYSFIYKYEDGDWKIDHLHSSLMPEKN